MTFSRLLLKPLEKMDFSTLRKTQGPQEKVKAKLTWENPQGVVTLVDGELPQANNPICPHC